MPCTYLHKRFSMFTHPRLGVHVRVRVLRPSVGRRARAGGAPSSCPSSTSFFTHFDTAGRAGSKRRRSRRGLCAPTSLSLGPPLVLWRTAFPVPSLFSSSHPPIPRKFLPSDVVFSFWSLALALSFVAERRTGRLTQSVS